MENQCKEANTRPTDGPEEEDTEAVVEDVEEAAVTIAVKRRAQKRKNEVIRRESMILSQRKNHEDKVVDTIEAAEEVAVAAVVVVVVIGADQDLAVKGLETSLELTETTIMREIAQVRVTVVKEVDVEEVIQADVHADSEDAQDAHQHRAPEMKAVDTATTTTAVTNTKTIVETGTTEETGTIAATTDGMILDATEVTIRAEGAEIEEAIEEIVRAAIATVGDLDAGGTAGTAKL